MKMVLIFVTDFPLENKSRSMLQEPLRSSETVNLTQKPQPYVTPGKPSGHYIFSFLVKEDKAEADGMWAKFQPEYIAF